jgi:hypothetical protein
MGTAEAYVVTYIDTQLAGLALSLTSNALFSLFRPECAALDSLGTTISDPQSLYRPRPQGKACLAYTPRPGPATR